MSKKPAVSNLEEHFLLQVPDHIAARLQALIQQAENAPGDVAVTFDEGGPDKPQSAALRVDGTDLPARLCKLPTIVETHKSLDGETYYKTGQVGQMLVVDDEEAALPTDLELRDGLAPPTANIRKRKWRKRPERNEKELEQVQLELESLVNGGRPPPPHRELIEEEVEEEVGAEGGAGGAGPSGTSGAGPSSSGCFGSAGGGTSGGGGSELDDGDDFAMSLEAEMAEAEEEPAAPSAAPPAPPPSAPTPAPKMTFKLPALQPERQAAAPSAYRAAAAAAPPPLLSQQQAAAEAAARQQQAAAQAQAAQAAAAQQRQQQQVQQALQAQQQAEQRQALLHRQQQVDAAVAKARQALTQTRADHARVAAMNVSSNPALAVKRDAKLKQLEEQRANAETMIEQLLAKRPKLD